MEETETVSWSSRLALCDYEESEDFLLFINQRRTFSPFRSEHMQKECNCSPPELVAALDQRHHGISLFDLLLDHIPSRTDMFGLEEV